MGVGGAEVRRWGAELVVSMARNTRSSLALISRTCSITSAFVRAISKKYNIFYLMVCVLHS